MVIVVFPVGCVARGLSSLGADMPELVLLIVVGSSLANVFSKLATAGGCSIRKQTNACASTVILSRVEGTSFSREHHN